MYRSALTVLVAITAISGGLPRPAAAVVHPAVGASHGLDHSNPSAGSSWSYYHPLPATPAPPAHEPGAQPPQEMPHAAEAPAASHWRPPHEEMENRYGYPAYEDPLFSEGRPEYRQQHLARPVYDRPTFERPSLDKPHYGWEPIRKPNYEMPLMAKPNDDRPRYQKQIYNPPAYARPSKVAPVYQRPNDPRPTYRVPAFEKPGFERPRYDRPEYLKPEDPRQEYHKPREVAPPYLAPAR